MYSLALRKVQKKVGSVVSNVLHLVNNCKFPSCLVPFHPHSEDYQGKKGPLNVPRKNE